MSAFALAISNVLNARGATVDTGASQDNPSRTFDIQGVAGDQIAIDESQDGTNWTELAVAGGTNTSITRESIARFYSSRRLAIGNPASPAMTAQLGALTPSTGVTQSAGLANGDGSDGAGVVNGGTTTLTRDMNWASLHVTSTGVLETAGFRIFCQTPPLIDLGGIIDCSGSAGQAGNAGHLGGAGAPQGSLFGGSTGGHGGVGAVGQNGVNSTTQWVAGPAGALIGGAGGAGTGGHAGGAGGTMPATPIVQGRSAADATFAATESLANPASATLFEATGGGGGGDDGAGNDGGGAGGGGGTVEIWAPSVTNNGTIRANGGGGGAGGAGNAGGGGGGGGGCVRILGTLTGSGVTQAAGGLGGAGNGTGAAGLPGAAGVVIHS
jgi:hypothetical protein